MEPRARLELAFPDYRSGASPPMLTGLVILEPMERIERSSVAYHATARPVSYIGWSECGESNSVARTGDPMPNQWATPAETSGADGDNRNLFSGLEAQGTPYIPRPLISHFCDAIQLSKTCFEAHLNCLASSGKQVRRNGPN